MLCRWVWIGGLVLVVGAGCELPSDAASGASDGAPAGERGDQPTGGGGGLPCDVAQVLETHCALCHNDGLQFGAPMSLREYADLVAPAASDPSRKVYELLLGRVKGETGAVMPPPPSDPLGAEDIAVLEGWIAAGAPASEMSCAPPADPGSQGPGEPTGGGLLPYPTDCERTLELRAHAGQRGFSVPQEDDHYECFYFRAPREQVYARGFRPLIDDDRVIHHWLLYEVRDGGLEDGSTSPCSGVHPGAALLAGWAPGGPAYGLPDAVGVQMPTAAGDGFFILENHYNNVARHADAVDQSGVEVCVSSTPPENPAAIHWLGTENILLRPGETSAGSTCAPELTEPVHIVSVTPHMHELGVHARMVIERADGSEDVLLDKAFDFEYQTTYPTPAVLRPGDRIHSTCTWQNSTGGLVTFGEGTADEMCYLFTLAYPVGPLNRGGDFALLPGGIPGENKCMR